jgi:hypothetical protein
MASRFLDWIARAWARRGRAGQNKKSATRAHFERFEPRTVLSASFHAMTHEYPESAPAALGEFEDYGAQSAYIGSTAPAGWMEDREPPRRDLKSQRSYREPAGLVRNTPFARNQEPLPMVVVIASAGGAGGDFILALPPPPLSSAVYSTPSYVAAIIFREERPRNSNAARMESPQFLQRHEDAPVFRHPAGPAAPGTYPPSANDPGGSNVISPSSPETMTAMVPETASDRSSMPSRLPAARDSVFAGYNSQRLLLTGSAKDLVDLVAAEQLVEPISVVRAGAVDPVHLDDFSMMGENELAANRLASELAATDEVLQSLRPIDNLDHNSKASPLADDNHPLDQAFALFPGADASRALAPGQPRDGSSSSTYQGGMILLQATGDANEGVCEVAGTGQADQQSNFILGTNVGAGNDIASDTAEEPHWSHPRGEPLSSRLSDQSVPSVLPRLSRQQAAMLAATGAVWGGVLWSLGKKACAIESSPTAQRGLRSQQRGCLPKPTR